MKSLGKNLIRKVYFSLLVVLLISGVLRGQTAATGTGGIRGQVTDPSGGTLVGATVLLTTPSGGSMDTTTGKDGYYEFKNLPLGKYGLKVVVKGFALYAKEDVSVMEGKITSVNISMVLEV